MQRLGKRGRFTRISNDRVRDSVLNIETFEKCSILFKIKEGENSDHRNT